MKRLSNIKLTPEERKAIIEFSRRVKKALGKQIKTIKLFGSKARGDFHKDSDIDIYIIVKGKNIESSIKFLKLMQTFGISMMNSIYIHKLGCHRPYDDTKNDSF